MPSPAAGPVSLTAPALLLFLFNRPPSGDRILKGSERDDMKVVFLDVDGVLHPIRGGSKFLPECMAVLGRILKAICPLISALKRRYC